MKKAPIKPYKLKFTKEPRRVEAGDFAMGEIFYRQGSPHMVVVIKHIQDVDHSDKVTVCNLASGSVWQIDKDESVTICHNPNLTFATDGLFT